MARKIIIYEFTDHSKTILPEGSACSIHGNDLDLIAGLIGQPVTLQTSGTFLITHNRMRGQYKSRLWQDIRNAAKKRAVGKIPSTSEVRAEIIDALEGCGGVKVHIEPRVYYNDYDIEMAKQTYGAGLRQQGKIVLNRRW